jgi:cell division protein FtsL
MNAASRLVYQGTFTKQNILSFLLTKTQISIGVLTLMLLLTSIGVVYITYLKRISLSELQLKEHEYAQLQMRYSQLILERGVYSNHSRVVIIYR